MGHLARKLLLATVVMGGALYVAAPFWTAWSIREAVKGGDVALLQQKIVWPSVRQSLRASIVQHAQLLPAAVQAGQQIKPTLWQRIKFMFGESMLDRFMDRYITAAGLPNLYRLKHGYRTRVQGLPDEHALPFAERAGLFLKRIKRAEFVSLGHVEIEVQDRDQPERRIVGTLNLIGVEWKLTKITVRSVPIRDNDADFAAASTVGGGQDEEARLYADDVKNRRLNRPSGRGI